MWFGTGNGLNKYNGYDITVYRHDPDNPKSISGNNISAIYEDKRGNLWIGTTGAGLNMYNRDEDSFRRFKIDYTDPDAGISDNSITSILETREGSLWIGTYNGLNIYDRDKDEFIQIKTSGEADSGLGSNYINYLYEDKEGVLWIGTDNGLNLWDPVNEEFMHFTEETDDPANRINNVLVLYDDSRNNFWAGTKNGLVRYNRETESLTRYVYDSNDPGSISGNAVFSILEDNQGLLWIGTENNGLNVFDYKTESFYHYKQNLDDPNSLNSNAIYDIFENSEHILWVGTYSGGINYIDRKKQKFELYKYDKNLSQPLSTNSVTSFLEDRNGNMWVGTDGGGLNLFNRQEKTFQALRHDPRDENSLSSDVVLALLQGVEDYIWIGYYRGGISRYNVKTKEFTHFKHIRGDSTSLCHNDVFALYKDQNEDLWVGTNGGGICKFDPKTEEFSKYQLLEGVVRDILIDTKNNFWVATYGGGLKLVDLVNEGVWNFYEGDHGLRSNIMLTLHEDQRENFWIGTMEDGLNLFDRDSLRFTSFNSDDGLSSDAVKGILEDDGGRLWLSTNNGISSFDPETKSFQNFYLEDGLQGNEFNALAYYKDQQGYMYFGGINGFNRFHPDSIRTDSSSYPVMFTDFKIFNNTVTPGPDSPLKKHISQTSEITVPYSASVLTFEYAALNYNEIKGVRYSYLLEGFEEEWNEVGNKRSTTYTNLSAGDYVLRVRSSSLDGDWSEETSLALTVTPPFWQTYWFYLVVLLFAGGSIFGIYRVRVRQITKQNRLLIQKVDERTSELNQRNKDLEKALDDLRETRSELIEKAHKAGMADIATGVVHNIGNVLNSIGTSNSISADILSKPKFEGLFKANKLLLEHADHLEEFLNHDPRGKKLIAYYQKLDASIRHEVETLKENSERISKKVDLITGVIAAQQNYASVGLNSEQTKLDQVLEDALTIYGASLSRHGIRITKKVEETPGVLIQKTKLVHVLINIFKNAKDAINEAGKLDKEIVARVYQNEQKAIFRDHR